MHRERVSENVFWFQSEIYAQVTAGVVAGPQWAVVIDTLALPDETLTIREFIEHELSVPVRYVINTHYHADMGKLFLPRGNDHRTRALPRAAGGAWHTFPGSCEKAKSRVTSGKDRFAANDFCGG